MACCRVKSDNIRYTEVLTYKKNPPPKTLNIILKKTPKKYIFHHNRLLCLPLLCFAKGRCYYGNETNVNFCGHHEQKHIIFSKIRAYLK